jgi:dTDP-glucose 4,6-dehydratase
MSKYNRQKTAWVNFRTLNFYPKVVLITGIAGFIGSNVLEYLANMYNDILFIGVDKLTYCSDLRNLDCVYRLPNFVFYQYDLNNEELVAELFRNYNIDTVMHFAAYTHVDHSFLHSLDFSMNNIIATHILLEQSKRSGIERFIYVSTDEIYGSSDSISDETTCSDPTNPYSASKCAAESIAKSYYHSFKLPVIITRGNNVYGPYQYQDKLIPLFTLNLLKGIKSQIHGTGEQKRSFLHVADVVLAFETILFQGVVGEIYNIGSEEELSVNQIAEKLRHMIQPDKDFDTCFEYGKDRPFNDQRYNICSNKLRALGWEPTITFEEGLKNTIEWYSKPRSMDFLQRFEIALNSKNKEELRWISKLLRNTEYRDQLTNK